MQDECRLRIDQGLGTFEGAEAALDDLAVAADDGVAALGDGDLDGGLVGIEDDDDVAPVVAACIAFQTEGDDGLGGLEKLEVLAHEVGIAESEGGMVPAQLDEVLIVVEDLGIGGLAAPVDVAI